MLESINLAIFASGGCHVKIVLRCLPTVSEVLAKLLDLFLLLNESLLHGSKDFRSLSRAVSGRNKLTEVVLCM